MKNKPTVLLINPWIYDFAAFDLYMKPYGLLTLAANLQKAGYEIIFLDCLDRFDDYFKTNHMIHNKKNGTGKFHHEIIEKPEMLKFYPRYYKRYGLPMDEVHNRLNNFSKLKIDAILIGSLMTYWYPGVFDMIKLVKTIWPDKPVILGGIYATIMKAHAEQLSAADHVITGTDMSMIIRQISSILKYDQISENEIFQEEPLFSLYNELSYMIVSLSTGCPYKCTYCASQLLYPSFRKKDMNKLTHYLIPYLEKYNIQHIGFYDDALLYCFPEMLKKFLDNLRSYSLNYYTPNGVHIKFINDQVAEYLYQAQFKMLRLSLESSSVIQQESTGNKTSNKQFKNSIQNLHKAGFEDKNIEVYILFGMFNQTFQEIKDTIQFIKDTGGTPKIVEYSLIPGTKDYEFYYKSRSIDPLLTNNSLFYMQSSSLTIDDLNQLRDFSRMKV